MTSFERYSEEAVKWHIKHRRWHDAHQVLQKLCERRDQRGKEGISLSKEKKYRREIEEIKKSKGWGKNTEGHLTERGLPNSFYSSSVEPTQ